ncbi:MAG: hypothetical protein WCW78_01870 [Candidatus Paceibacterota bacterium]|jgi:hypothetical protein
MAKESRVIVFVAKHIFGILVFLVALVAGAFIFAIYTTDQERDVMRANFKPGVPCKIIHDIKVTANRNLYTIYWFDNSGNLCTKSSDEGASSGRSYYYKVKNDCPQNTAPYVEYFNTDIGLPDSAVIHVHSLTDLNCGTSENKN